MGNDPLDETDPSGNCLTCLVGVLVEVGFEAYTGELGNSISQAFEGNYKSLAVTGAKVGIAALSGGVSTALATKGAAIAVKAAEVVNGGVTAIKAATVAGMAGAQALNGAATKAATNAVEGKPVGQGVATAAAVGSVVGTAGSVAGNKAAAAVGGEVGANAAAVTKVATQVISGAAKKETNCSISNGNPC